MLLASKCQVCWLQTRKAPCFETCTAEWQTLGTSTIEIWWPPATFIRFTGITDKMPRNAHMSEHTLISKLFTYCDIQTCRDIWASKYLALLSNGEVIHEKLISDKLSVLCGIVTAVSVVTSVLIIFLTASQASGESHRMGTGELQVPVLVLLVFLMVMDNLILFSALFSLSLLSFYGLAYLFGKFSNTWNYFWDGTIESFLDLIRL